MSRRAGLLILFLISLTAFGWSKTSPVAKPAAHSPTPLFIDGHDHREGEAAKAGPPPKHVEAAAPGTTRQKAVARAEALVGFHGNRFVVGAKSFRADCSGFVEACYEAAGLSLSKSFGKHPTDSGVKNLFEAFRLRSWKNAERTPKAGDLVFFNNTFDRNLNRKWDDPLTHVGLVESVDAAGTVTFVHHVSGRVVRAHLNLKKPDAYSDAGKVVNDFLRKRLASDRNKTRYLTSRLFAGFAETPVK